MLKVKQLEDELKELSSGLGIADKKLLGRFEEAGGLQEVWGISLGDIRQRPDEIKAKIRRELTQLAEWLIEAKIGYSDDGGDVKQFASIFRVSFNLGPEPSSDQLLARYIKLAPSLHRSESWVRKNGYEAIRRVAEYLASQGNSNTEENEYQTYSERYEGFDFHLDGWRFKEVSLYAQAKSFDSISAGCSFHVAIEEDGIDRIGVFFEPVPGYDGAGHFPVVASKGFDIDHEVYSHQLTENSLYRVVSLGGRKVQGDLVHVGYGTLLEGVVAPACIFTPINPCDRLTVALNFAPGVGEDLPKVGYVPGEAPSVYAIPGLPPQLAQDYLRELIESPHTSSDRFVHGVSPNYHPVDLKIKPPFPYVAEFLNLKPGLTYGLAWRWQTWTLSLSDKTIDTHFGAFLKAHGYENPRPSPEGEGGEGH